MTNLNTNIILTIIKVSLLISICAFITAFYALQNENKIENLYEKIEKLRSSNVDLNDWSLTFSKLFGFKNLFPYYKSEI